MKRTGGGGGGCGDGLTQGEIIQVQGGHIIRATGRKDRHSKVYSSKGPRDRRVRLSAHTAIQFYDVQDRLGYDRASKAVDWLIKKAKNAIDKLDELPQHNPNSNEIAVATAQSTDSDPGSTEPSSSVYAIQQSHLHENSDGIIPPLETQSISDTMKSFFPVSPGNSLMSMQGFPNERMPTQHHHQIKTEDLGLSLHTLQDHQNLSHHHRNYSTEQMVFSGSNPGMFDASYHQKNESWGGGNVGESRIGSIFNPHLFPQQLFFSQSSSSASAFSHQREPLQSNYSNLLHQSWNAEQRLMPSVDQHHHGTQAINQSSSWYNFHFGSDFQVPAGIRGEEEPGGGGVSLQPSSVSPSSQH